MSDISTALLGLQQLRSMLSESIDLGEVVNTAPMRQFVRAIAHQIKGVEHQLEQLVVAAKEAPAPDPSVSWTWNGRQWAQGPQTTGYMAPTQNETHTDLPTTAQYYWGPDPA